MNRIKTFRIIVAVFFSTLFSLLLSGCVDEVQIDRDFGETQKLVVYSRLCPQMDTTYILLTNTKLLYAQNSSGNRQLTDGTVELSADGTFWVQAIYDSVRQRYRLTKQEFPIEEGHTYYLRASYPGYEEVSAFCTVPVTHDVGFRFDTVETNGDVHWGEIYNWTHKDVYVEWRDVAGDENYYGLYIYQPNYYYTEDPETGEFMIVPNGWNYYNPWLTENNSEYRFVTDEGRDGQMMRFLLNADLYEGDDDWDWKKKSKGDDDEDDPSEYYLFFLDRNCYQYEKTLSDNDLDLGFLMLEPVHTYTNIENGFGLFGAFCMVRVQ